MGAAHLLVFVLCIDFSRTRAAPSAQEHRDETAVSPNLVTVRPRRFNPSNVSRRLSDGTVRGYEREFDHDKQTIEGGKHDAPGPRRVAEWPPSLPPPSASSISTRPLQTSPSAPPMSPSHPPRLLPYRQPPLPPPFATTSKSTGDCMHLSHSEFFTLHFGAQVWILGMAASVIIGATTLALAVRLAKSVRRIDLFLETSTKGLEMSRPAIRTIVHNAFEAT